MSSSRSPMDSGRAASNRCTTSTGELNAAARCSASLPQPSTFPIASGYAAMTIDTTSAGAALRQHRCSGRCPAQLTTRAVAGPQRSSTRTTSAGAWWMAARCSGRFLEPSKRLHSVGVTKEAPGRCGWRRQRQRSEQRPGVHGRQAHQKADEMHNEAAVRERRVLTVMACHWPSRMHSCRRPIVYDVGVAAPGWLSCRRPSQAAPHADALTRAELLGYMPPGSGRTGRSAASARAAVARLRRWRLMSRHARTSPTAAGPVRAPPPIESTRGSAQSILSMAGKSGAVISVPALMMPLLRMAPGPAHRDVGRSAQTQRHPGEQRGRAHR